MEIATITILVIIIIAGILKVTISIIRHEEDNENDM